jgi:hypothetical protein
MPDQKPLHWTAWSLTLFIIGLLILVPSGLCTGVFGIGVLFDSNSGWKNAAIPLFVMVLVIGGLPMFVGGALVAAGLGMRRRNEPQNEKRDENRPG